MYLHIYGRNKWSLKWMARRLNRLYKRRRTCNFSSSRGTPVWEALAGWRETEDTLFRRPRVSWIVFRWNGTRAGADVYGGSFELLNGRARDTPRSLYERSEIMIFQWYVRGNAWRFGVYYLPTVEECDSRRSVSYPVVTRHSVEV